VTGPRSGGNQPSAPALLLDYVRGLGRSRAGRYAVHLNLSKLQPHNRRDKHIRTAVNCLDVLVKHYEGRIFELPSSDVIFLCHRAEPRLVDEAVKLVKFLFVDDPFAQDSPGEASRFAVTYDLEQSYDKLLALAESIFETALRRPAGVAAPPPVSRLPLDARRLAEIIDAIGHANLANLLRCQPICRFGPDGKPDVRFEEVYVSIDELRDILLPDYDLASDRWLFRYLTRVLDRRVLNELTHGRHLGALGRSSINVNLATLLSQDFLDFDAGLRTGVRSSIVLELQFIDVLADFGAYRFASRVARDRGYQVCLDGVDYRQVAFLDAVHLAADFLKIPWNAAATAQISTEAAAGLQQLVRAVGGERVVLCRCDAPVALKFGRTLGIELFQGRHVDALLAAGGGAGRTGTRKLGPAPRRPAPGGPPPFGVIGG
jgi:EAL domain-containing protein (putative c-di-GMP-specific phosphodiesterase class I)